MSDSLAAAPPAPIPRSPWVLVPPPPMFVAMFLAGTLLGRWLPAALVPGELAGLARGLGIGALVAAGLLIVSAPLLFLVHRTTIIPHAEARTLVTGGPFRFTRNPMYLALVTAYLGVALVLDVLWPVVLLALPIWVLATRVIPFEERRMEAAFGDAYRAYRRRVRRWL